MCNEAKEAPEGIGEIGGIGEMRRVWLNTLQAQVKLSDSAEKTGQIWGLFTRKTSEPHSLEQGNAGSSGLDSTRCIAVCRCFRNACNMHSHLKIFCIGYSRLGCRDFTSFMCFTRR